MSEVTVDFTGMLSTAPHESGDLKLDQSTDAGSGDDDFYDRANFGLWLEERRDSVEENRGNAE